MDVLLGQDPPEPGVAVGLGTVDVQPEVAEVGAVFANIEGRPGLKIGSVF